MMDLDSFLVSLYVYIDEWWKAFHPPSASQARPSGAAFRERGPYPGHPRPVALLSQRARLLAFRFLAPAPLLPRPVLPEPAQPQGASPGARVARSAAGLRRGSYGPFGSLPRDGHDPRPGHREGEGFPQRAVRRSGFLRAQRVEDGVGLRVQGGPGGGSRRGDHGLRVGGGVLRRAAHSRGPHSLRPLRCLPGLPKGFTGIEWERRWPEQYGALVAATPYDHSRRAWSKEDRRWASGKRQIIEGVIHQLKDFFSLEGHRAKTLGGLLARLAAKVAAYTCAQRLNDSLGRPKRQLADLLL
jgi:hypothetical protein